MGVNFNRDSYQSHHPNVVYYFKLQYKHITPLSVFGVFIALQHNLHTRSFYWLVIMYIIYHNAPTFMVSCWANTSIYVQMIKIVGFKAFWQGCTGTVIYNRLKAENMEKNWRLVYGLFKNRRYKMFFLPITFHTEK